MTRLAAWGMAMIVALTACVRSHGRDTLDLRNPSDTLNGRANSDASAPGARSAHPAQVQRDASTANGGGFDGAAGPHTQPTQGDAAPDTLAAPAQDGTQVWIGQLWNVVPELCVPGAPLTSPLQLDPSGSVERVVLILERAGDGSLGGRISLGAEVQLPADPSDGPNAMSNPVSSTAAYWSCSMDMPTSGFEYTLFDAEASSDRIEFSIFPNEVWTRWCAGQTEVAPCFNCRDLGPICECMDGACKFATQRPFVVDLAVTADSLEGELPLSGGFGTPAQLRLTRKR
jgi:hypothetical protein